MALKRRSGSQFSANIWPGFVDAMTALLLVLMFVLTIFMIVQFVLRDTINGQDRELDQLSIEIQGLASALGLERGKSAALEDSVSTLNSTLTANEQAAQERQALIDTLTIQGDTQSRKIEGFELQVTGFEAQVAGLLSQNLDLSANLTNSASRITVLTGETTALKARNQRLSADIAGQSSQFAAMVIQTKTLSRNLAEQENRNQQLTADLATRSGENDQLRAQNNALNVDVAHRTQTNRELDARNRQLAADIAGSKGNSAQLARENRSLTAEITRNTRANAALEAQNKQLAATAEGQADDNRELSEQNQLLLADKDALERANLQVISQSEALQLALVQARDEMDALVEAARLAAIKREMIQTILADLQTQVSDGEGSLGNALAALAASDAALGASQANLTDTRDALDNSQRVLASTQDTLKSSQSQIAAKGLSEAELQTRIAKMTQGLSDAEKSRLAEAVAAAALRARLKGAQDELTAMTLSLETQRQHAEDALTLLAAAELAEEQAVDNVAEGLTVRQKNAALLATAHSLLAQEKALSADGKRKVTLLNLQTVELRKQLDALQGLLDQSKERDVSTKVQIKSLGSNLNAALAQVAAKQKKLAQEQTKLAAEQLARADLEEKERIRLQAETKDLKKFRSEFFGQLRDVLGAQEGIRIVGDRFVFSSEILFSAGSADLGERGKVEISKVAGIILDVADQIPDGIDWVLRVDGHTDKTPVSGFGKYKDNWELSQARALSVVKYLIKDLGIPANRLAANGFGEFQPIVDGVSREALALNRRIELKFTER